MRALILFLALLGLSTPVSGAPPQRPLTTCTASLCFDVLPDPLEVVSRQSASDGTVTTTIRVAHGVVLGVHTRAARATDKAEERDFRWVPRSELTAVTSACLNCNGDRQHKPLRVGMALVADSPEKLESYLRSGHVSTRQLNLLGFRTDEFGAALRVSEGV